MNSRHFAWLPDHGRASEPRFAMRSCPLARRPAVKRKRPSASFAGRSAETFAHVAASRHLFPRPLRVLAARRGTMTFGQTYSGEQSADEPSSSQDDSADRHRSFSIECAMNAAGDFGPFKTHQIKFLSWTREELTEENQLAC